MIPGFETTAGEWLLAATLFGGLLATAEICFRIGQRAQGSKGASESDHLSTIQGAILGLLGLLLGFSFSAASDRYTARAQLIRDEANAIGTLWLRVDLLPAEKQPALRQVLRQYVAARIALFDAKDANATAAAVGQSESLHARMWEAMAAGARAAPEFSEVLLPVVNDVIDIHGKRVTAARRHLPPVIVFLLLTCSGVAIGAVSYGCGASGKRSAVLLTALTFLVAAVLWAILDLDHPRHGLIQSGQQPMLDLQKSLRP